MYMHSELCSVRLCDVLEIGNCTTARACVCAVVVAVIVVVRFECAPDFSGRLPELNDVWRGGATRPQPEFIALACAATRFACNAICHRAVDFLYCI